MVSTLAMAARSETAMRGTPAKEIIRSAFKISPLSRTRSRRSTRVAEPVRVGSIVLTHKAIRRPGTCESDEKPFYLGDFFKFFAKLCNIHLGGKARKIGDHLTRWVFFSGLFYLYHFNAVPDLLITFFKINIGCYFES